MKTLFTLLFAFLFLATNAQEPTLLWVQGIGGNADDNLISNVTKTNSDGFILHIETNSAYGSGNIDSFCRFGGDREVFLTYDSDFSTSRSHQCYGAEGDSFISYIFPINGGGYVQGGEFNSDTGWGFLIRKEDSIGNTIWQKSYSKGSNAILKAMTATDDGGYLMCGICTYIDTNFTHHNGGFINPDIGIIKLDSIGNKVWSKVIGGSDIEDVFSLSTAPMGGCYIFGSTESTDYDCSGNNGQRDAYLVRLDKNGNILWHHDLGGSGDDGYYGWGIADSKGGVILATGSNSADGDIHHHIGNYDYWALEIDSNNNILWENNYGSAGSYEFPTSICKATDGSIWMTGESSLKGGEVDTSYGNGDAWIVHADSTGNFMNAKVLGSSGSDEGTMIYPLSNGNVITGGLYAGSNGDFNSLTYYGSSITFNAFLATFGPDAASVKPVQNTVAGFSIFPNPANDVLNIVISKAIHTDALVTIGDVMGNSMYSDTWPATTKELKIDVSNWARGVYFVQINTIDGTISDSKIVVQ